MNTLFDKEMEETAISRIQRFAKLTKAMELGDVCLGFSGGKDSQVVYDLCLRAGIEFKAYYNVAFESSITKTFIRRHYPEVVWRQEHKFGFIDNICKNHNGLLPTVQMAYCCADYKHNPKYVDKSSIVGVRRAESMARKKRTTVAAKNKTILKKNKQLIGSYFEEHCQSTGSAHVIQLKPIIDWTDNEVWGYIHRHKLPINPEYENRKRVGCIVCPKANFNSNYKALLDNPKLIDAFIRAREKGKLQINWIITSDNKDYSEDKPYYICRWLNHSFMPFTKRQEEEYREVRKVYDSIKNKSVTNN